MYCLTARTLDATERLDDTNDYCRSLPEIKLPLDAVALFCYVLERKIESFPHVRSNISAMMMAQLPSPWETDRLLMPQPQERFFFTENTHISKIIAYQVIVYAIGILRQRTPDASLSSTEQMGYNLLGPSQFKLFLISVQHPSLCEPGTDTGHFMDTVAICLDLSAEL
ncbi:hypothetical protein BJX65DRAFT_136147 [Aspergillus insuetus]